MSYADNFFAQSRTFDKSIATQYAFFLIAPCCEQTLHYSQNNLWFYLLWNLYLHFQWTALFWVENNCIYYDQRQPYHLTTRFPHAPETDQRSKYAMQAEKPSGLECALKKKLKKTYMQRTLCQVFPAEGKLPVGGFAARKILPCKLCDNCGRSVCNHLILSGYILCYLVLTEAPWTSSQGWKRHTSNSWKQSTWSSWAIW